mgnify:CR=1 FL=1
MIQHTRAAAAACVLTALLACGCRTTPVVFGKRAELRRTDRVNQFALGSVRFGFHRDSNWRLICPHATGRLALDQVAVWNKTYAYDLAERYDLDGYIEVSPAYDELRVKLFLRHTDDRPFHELKHADTKVFYCGVDRFVEKVYDDVELEVIRWRLNGHYAIERK